RQARSSRPISPWWRGRWRGYTVGKHLHCPHPRTIPPGLPFSCCALLRSQRPARHLECETAPPSQRGAIMGRALAGVVLAVLCLVEQAASAKGPKTLLTIRDEPKRGHGVWAALSPDGKLLGLSCNGEVTVRALYSGKVLQRLKRITSADGEVPRGLVF